MIRYTEMLAPSTGIKAKARTKKQNDMTSEPSVNGLTSILIHLIMEFNDTLLYIQCFVIRIGT